MASGITEQSGFERWQKGLAAAQDHAEWHGWDADIQLTVEAYNCHLAGTSDYRQLDWRLVKAMLWVETGAGSSE